MKITFLEEHESKWSGNSRYQSGTRADLRHGAILVQMGVAAQGWSKPTAEPTAEPTTEAPLSERTVAELQEIAAAVGIPYSGLRKAELIAAIEGSGE